MLQITKQESQTIGEDSWWEPFYFSEDLPASDMQGGGSINTC